MYSKLKKLFTKNQKNLVEYSKSYHNIGIYNLWKKFMKNNIIILFFINIYYIINKLQFSYFLINNIYLIYYNYEIKNNILCITKIIFTYYIEI